MEQPAATSTQAAATRGWRLYIRCLGGVVFGVILATGLSLILSIYADFEAPEALENVTSATVVPFPGSDGDLREAARQLLSQDLERVEPASGEN